MSHSAFEKTTAGDLRLVALDVRPHSFGYIVLEAASVLDCGSRSCKRHDANECLSTRFRTILHKYSPSVVLMNSIRMGTRQVAPTSPRNELAKSLLGVSGAYGTTVVTIAPAAVREYFLAHDAHTKYEIATAVARFLPELAWKLPPQRKAWESEHYRMAIFNAAAIALAHFGSRCDEPPPQLA